MFQMKAVNNNSISSSVGEGRNKGKVHPRTGHKGLGGE
jgi:hypothetical protein